jgi:hypothetical protein
MTKFLYLTDNKPSRKAARQFSTWLQENYPECSFVEVNVDRRSHPEQNAGRYRGWVEGPELWGDDNHNSHREAVYTAARSMLAA